MPFHYFDKDHAYIIEHIKILLPKTFYVFDEKSAFIYK